MNSTPINWDDAYDSGTDFRAISQRDITAILKHVPPPQDTANSLDIGCGTGQLTRELWHRGFSPTGVDISPRAIALAKSYTVLDDTEIHYRVGNFETQLATELTSKKFTLITCKLVYAFINDKAAFLQNVTGLLASGGMFVIITPLISQMPSEKAHIAVDYEATIKELTPFFQVEVKKDARQALFICTLP
jgi:2-polyprenyl-3-methyl-5-hydroxy-6-metoxy-1,4-benzoquinol methylase